MKTTTLFLACTVLLVQGASAQNDNKAGTSAAQFLKIGVGARAEGMGEAMVSLAQDPSAMYWNPSGLVGVRSISASVSHTRWFADITHQYFGFVLPAGDDHRFGINATILNLGEMEVTTEQDPQGTGEFFKASDVAVGVSYAARLVDFFAFGVTVKYVVQSIYNESASTVAVDLGTTLITGYKGLTVGMAFTNFGMPMKLDGRDLHRTYDPNPNNATNTGVSSYLGTESWDLPLNFRVGIGWQLLGPDDALATDDQHAVLIAVDANHSSDAPEKACVGMEYSWGNLIAVRGGYHFNDDVRSWTAGAGLSWQAGGAFGLGIDYAYADLNPLGPVHTFTVTVGF